MKLFLLTLAFSFLAIFSIGQPIKAVYLDTEENTSEIIKKNKIVKEVIYSFTESKNGEMDSSLYKTIDYNSMGNIVQEVNYFGKTPSSKTYTYIYNQFGKIIKMTKGNGGSITIYEFDYDSIGNEITKYDFNEDTTSLTIEQKSYNSYNLATQLITKINNSDAYVSRLYFYDFENRIIKTDALDPSGSISYSYITEYDNNETLIFLVNNRGKKLVSALTKNSNGLCIKSKIPEFNRIDNYLYNPDNTIFQWEVSISNKKSQINRHYYFK